MTSFIRMFDSIYTQGKRNCAYWNLIVNVCVFAHVTGELLMEFLVSRRNKEGVILSTWSDEMGDTLHVLTWSLDKDYTELTLHTFSLMREFHPGLWCTSFTQTHTHTLLHYTTWQKIKIKFWVSFTNYTFATICSWNLLTNIQDSSVNFLQNLF